MHTTIQDRFKLVQHIIFANIYSYPALYKLITKLAEHFTYLEKHQFNPETIDLIIEGYPRSANTFAVLAFRSAQKKIVATSNHRHTPARVMLAVENNIPTLLLIRKPIDAVTSFAIRNPHYPLKVCLQDYIRFYTSVAPVKDNFVIGHFEEVTTNFGITIDKINKYYNTSFDIFEHTPENVANCFEAIDSNFQKFEGPINELRISRPSPDRNLRLIELQDELINDPKLINLLTEANEIYFHFI